MNDREVRDISLRWKHTLHDNYGIYDTTRQKQGEDKRRRRQMNGARHGERQREKRHGQEWQTETQRDNEILIREE